MTPARRANLDRLLNPRHAAFIGGRDAAVAIGEAHRIGYSGTIWPVNPKRETLKGIPCFASVGDLPEAPDATFLAVPVPQAVETVRRLSARGAGGVVCYTAGFGETGGSGEAAERALVEAAGQMALVGPNCYGVINYLDRAALWPFAHGGGTPGYGAAIITQSGMLSSDLTMSQRSVPLTHMISIGNQSVLAIEDFIDCLSEHPSVRAIGLHIEGVKDIHRFAEASLKATELGKPVVALKTGSSAIGKSLASSHTGSLSGEDDLYDALFKRCGIVRVFSPAQLLETLKFICIAGVPNGNRIAGFTCSGGGAMMLADYAERIGLKFPRHDDAVTRRLEEALPPTATASNPLDYTTPIWGHPDQTRPVFEAAFGNGFDAAVLVQDYPAPGLDESRPFYLADGAAFADTATAAGIPSAICSTLPENLDVMTREDLIERGIAPMQGLNETLDAIAAAADWGQMRARIARRPPAALLASGGGAKLRALDEAAAKEMLRSAGVTVPEGMLCDGASAPEAASALGFPVAVKMVGEQLLHKTEARAVILDLKTSEDVAAAVSQIENNVGARQAEALTDSFLVERMQSPPLAEFIVSIRRDAQFGLAMTIGSGGLLVELVGDTATVLLPCSEEDIADAVGGLRAARLLDGFRGRPRADLGRLVAALMQIARFMEQAHDHVAEIEINPMFVYQDVHCAVDALIHLDDAS